MKHMTRWYRGSKIEVALSHRDALWEWGILSIDGQAANYSGTEATRTSAMRAAKRRVDKLLGKRAVEVQDQPAKAKRRTPRSHAAQAVKAVLAMTPAQRVEQRQTWRDQALRESLIAQGIIKIV